MAVGNGQFVVFNAPAYRSVGGRVAVAGDVLEDVGLARAMRRAGYRTAVVDGSAIAKCRMYETTRELVDGYTKPLWAASGSEKGALGIAGLLKLLYVLPPLSAATSRDRNDEAWGAVGYAAEWQVASSWHARPVNGMARGAHPAPVGDRLQRAYRDLNLAASPRRIAVEGSPSPAHLVLAFKTAKSPDSAEPFL